MSAPFIYPLEVDYYSSNKSKAPTSKRTKKDYSLMIKAVRKGYKQLSSLDKYIYEILTEYDFADAISGICKGYIFPDPKRIAADYNMPVRTLYRHLAQLKEAHLIKCIRRQYRGPVIQLLDIPEALLSTYRNERRLPEMANLYRKNIVTNRRIVANVATVDFLFSAREYACYERLLSWGYHPTQAIRDIANSEIGVEKVEQRLVDLHTLLRAGWTPRQTFAQWLNWALRSDEAIAIRDNQAYPPADRPAAPRLSPEDFEEYIDERGYINVRPRQNDAGAALASSEAQTAPPTSSEALTIATDVDSTAVRLDGCGSINKYVREKRNSSTYDLPICLISSSFLPTSDGGRYYHSTNAILPHCTRPARSSPADAYATRPPLPRFTKTSFGKGGLVDRSGRGGCLGCVSVMCESENVNEREEKVKSKSKFEERLKDRLSECDCMVWGGEGKRKEEKIFFYEKYFWEVTDMYVRRLQVTETQRRKKKTMVRKTRIDKGSTQLTSRDIAVLHWVGEMYAVRVDQVRVLLERNRQLAEGEEERELTQGAARKVIERWLRRGVVRYEKYYEKQPGYIWLTSAGLREMGFKDGDVTYRDWSPSTQLNHYYWVNQVRLHYENLHKDAMEWACQRTLKATKANRKGHDVDGELFVDNKLYAIEVEITKKTPAITRDIMASLVRERVERTTFKYAAAVYFANQTTRALLQRTRESLTKDEQERVVIADIQKYV